MPERNFDDFDEFADNYRSIHTDNIKLSGVDSYYFAEMKVRLLQQFEKDEPVNILDIGCGDGATELFMQKYFPRWKVNAIDISEKSISVASQKNISSAEFSVYDGQQIPFADESFDIVFMAGVLHHVDFSLHSGLIREVNRVVKKEGKFYLYEHNPVNPLTRYLVKTCVFDKDAKLLQSNYAERLLKENNFSIPAKQFIIFFPRKTFLSKLIFLEKYLKWLPLGGQYLIAAKKKST